MTDKSVPNNDLLLALETSGKPLSFALLDNDHLMSEVLMHLPIQNKDGLALWIQRWFHDLNVTMEQLNGVVVSCGPGSFTGLRVGMSLAKGLCLARNIPLWAIPTLLAMAHAIPPTDRLLCPTTLARTKECYAAQFRWTSNGIQEVEPPFVADARSLANRLSGPAWIWGEGALGMLDDLQEVLPKNQQVLTSDAFLPRASSVARLGRQMIQEGSKPAEPDLEPFYLKRFPG